MPASSGPESRRPKDLLSSLHPQDPHSRPLSCRIAAWTILPLMLHSVHVSSLYIASAPQPHLRRIEDRRRRDGTEGVAYSSSQRPPRLERFSAVSSDPTEGSRRVKIRVKKSTRNPVDTSQLSAFGSVFYASGYTEDANSDGWVMMQSVSGVVEGEGGGDGGRQQEIVAVVAPGKYPTGSSIMVEARYLVAKPESLDWEKAAVLPFQAVNCLCPLLAMGYSELTARGKTFVVTGGHGSLAPFVVQIVKAWGGSVCCVTTRSEGTVRTLGAEATVDFRKQSYSEELEDICVVVDTLGREKEGAQRMLKELKGAEYVSLQPKVLKVAVEEGVLFGAGKILQYQKLMAKDDPRTYFLPNAKAMGLVSSVAEMVTSKAVELAGVGTEYVGMQEYMEALAWPKDTDTGLRYGFPAKTRRSWGWLEGGDYDEDGQYGFEDEPWEDKDEAEEDEEELEDLSPGAGWGEGGVVLGGSPDGGAAVPTGQVVRVKSRDELRALAREGGTMVFVSSRNCRTCKFLSPFYRKLARKQQLVWFGHVDASSHPEIAQELGMTAVPSFVTFREGEVVTAASTSNKKKIEQLVEELLMA